MPIDCAARAEARPCLTPCLLTLSAAPSNHRSSRLRRSFPLRDQASSHRIASASGPALWWRMLSPYPAHRGGYMHLPVLRVAGCVPSSQMEIHPANNLPSNEKSYFDLPPRASATSSVSVKCRRGGRRAQPFCLHHRPRWSASAWDPATARSAGLRVPRPRSLFSATGVDDPGSARWCEGLRPVGRCASASGG